MSHFCPHYPKPAKNKLGALRLFFSKRRSWLDGLYERSYTMKMGETHLPGLDLYVVNEPALVRQVLVEDAKNFDKPEMLAQALRPLLGDSLLSTNGEQWRRQRELMNPSFEAARVKLVFGRMQAAVQAMVERLRQVPPGAVHDIEAEITHVAADIILRTILSKPLDMEASYKVFKAFVTYQALVPQLLLPGLFGLRWLRPWWLKRASERAAAEIRNLMTAMILPRWQAYQDSLARGEADSGGEDILGALLKARDPDTGQPLPFAELVNQVSMLFMGGHETSATGMSWAVYLLANRDDIQQRLHAEALAHVDALDADPSRFKELTLARNVFREALRLFPPISFMARQANHCQAMRDKTVPQGASVIISPWLIHRHRQLWADPDAFDPDRFERTEATGEGPSTKESLRTGYIPFGMGPRVCIGAAFAQQEATLVLATLARHFRFEPVPGHVPEPVGRLTLRSGNGIVLKVFAREDTPG